MVDSFTSPTSHLENVTENPINPPLRPRSSRVPGVRIQRSPREVIGAFVGAYSWRDGCCDRCNTGESRLRITRLIDCVEGSCGVTQHARSGANLEFSLGPPIRRDEKIESTAGQQSPPSHRSDLPEDSSHLGCRAQDATRGHAEVLAQSNVTYEHVLHGDKSLRYGREIGCRGVLIARSRADATASMGSSSRAMRYESTAASAFP